MRRIWKVSEKIRLVILCRVDEPIHFFFSPPPFKNFYTQYMIRSSVVETSVRFEQNDSFFNGDVSAPLSVSARRFNLAMREPIFLKSRMRVETIWLSWFAFSMTQGRQLAPLLWFKLSVIFSAIYNCPLAAAIRCSVRYCCSCDACRSPPLPAALD